MNLYLAVFTGTPDAMQRSGWEALAPDQQQRRMAEGITAWHAWADRHRDAIVELGGPLGKTLQVSARGVAPASNPLSGYSVVRAESHEAAAALFAQHPHFSIFPGEAVEVMPILPVPGA